MPMPQGLPLVDAILQRLAEAGIDLSHDRLRSWTIEELEDVINFIDKLGASVKVPPILLAGAPPSHDSITGDPSAAREAVIAAALAWARDKARQGPTNLAAMSKPTAALYDRAAALLGARGTVLPKRLARSPALTKKQNKPPKGKEP